MAAVLGGLLAPAGAVDGGVTTPPQAAAGVPLPTLSRPPAGIHGHPMWDSWHALKPFGYTQREFLVSGIARATGGGAPAPFTTRIIVTRPRSERRFNGSAVVEWVNVTAQFENAVDIMEARQMLLREGFAYVHASIQRAGLCCGPLTPKVWDPVRYAAISHPGDDYAEDILSQVARAVRAPATRRQVMGGLRVRRVLAVGQSQSANRLHDYVATTQRSAGVIDGFLIHGGGEKRFPRRLDVPVVHLLSDREADPAPPTRDRRYRLWEVAGTAHSDYWIGYQSVHGLGPRLADRPPQSRREYAATIDAAGNYGQVPAPLQATCILAGATMPMHYAASTAVHQLDRWVRTRRAPARTPRFAFVDGRLATDRFGNTRGGIRMPPISVPVAHYRSTACPLGGITVPFTDAQLRRLYPTFAAYQRLMRRATDRAVRQGWLLRPDARDQMRRVCEVRSRYPAGDRGRCRGYTPPRFASSARQ